MTQKIGGVQGLLGQTVQAVHILLIVLLKNKDFSVNLPVFH